MTGPIWTVRGNNSPLYDGVQVDTVVGPIISEGPWIKVIEVQSFSICFNSEKLNLLKNQ